MKPAVKRTFDRRGARAKAQSSPPCSFIRLITPWIAERFHHLKLTLTLSRQRGALQTKKPAQRWMNSIRYSDDAPRARQPVATVIFQLYPENGDPDVNALSCDAEYSGLWREFFRSEIVKLASDPDNWDDPPLADELLTGHSSPNKPATRPHLAIVPLPSIDAAHKADGHVRRVALLGYAAPEVASKAISIYNTLFKALDDLILVEQTPFRRHGECVPVRLELRKPNADAVWHHLTSKSRVWCSIIPVAISRGFKVPKFHPDGRPMSDNERYHRKQYEWSELLRASLCHIGLPPELVAACAIETTATPLVPKSQRAEKYRAPGEKAVLTHVRLEFPAQVRGPLILGDRRYFGLGLFVPVADSSAATSGECGETPCAGTRPTETMSSTGGLDLGGGEGQSAASRTSAGGGETPAASSATMEPRRRDAYATL